MSVEEMLHTRMGYELPFIFIASLLIVLRATLKSPRSRKQKIVLIVCAPLVFLLEFFLVAIVLFHASGFKGIQDEIR
jgi:hypothetical protein